MLLSKNYHPRVSKLSENNKKTIPKIKNHRSRSKNED